MRTTNENFIYLNKQMGSNNNNKQNVNKKTNQTSKTHFLIGVKQSRENGMTNT